MKYEKPAVQRFGSLRELTLGNGPRLGGRRDEPVSPLVSPRTQFGRDLRDSTLRSFLLPGGRALEPSTEDRA